MGEFDDLIPGNETNEFSDLIPGKPIQSSENVMKRALTPRAKVAEGLFNNPIMKNPFVKAISSVTPFGAARSLYESPENAPLAGGLGGGLIGGTVGAPNVGMGLGTAAGEAAKQGVDWFKYGDRPTAGSLAKIPLEGAGAYVGGKLLEGGIALGKGAFGLGRKAAGWVAEPFQKTGTIMAEKRAAEEAIKSTTSKGVSEADRLGGLRKRVATKLYQDEPLAGLEGEKSYLEKELARTTHKEAIQSQQEMRALSGKKSAEFGKKLEELTVGAKPVKASDVLPGVENALTKHGVLKYTEMGELVPARAPMNATETKMLNFWRNTKAAVNENPDVVIDASDLVKGQEAIRTPFGKTKTGTDVLKDTVRENISEVLEPSTPGLRELRSSHAPWMKVKKQGIKELQPWNTEYDTGKAAKFISRKSTGQLSPDEKSLVGHLEKELGREINPQSRKFGNRLIQSAGKEKLIKEKAATELAKIDSVVEQTKEAVRQTGIKSQQELEKVVDELMRKNNLSRWVRGGIAGAVAGPTSALVGNYVVSKVLKLIKGDFVSF